MALHRLKPPGEARTFGDMMVDLMNRVGNMYKGKPAPIPTRS